MNNKLVRIIKVLAITLTSLSCYAATFNPATQMTLTDFGTTTNQNTSLQIGSRYPSDPAGQLLRTNDFQTFQLNFGGYAAGRLPTRMGLFNVSESAIAPFGTRVELAGFTRAGNEALNIEPNSYINMVPDPNFILFNFTEALTDTNVDLLSSDTFLDCYVIYEASAGSMTSYHVHGSAYNDIQYESVTPKLTFGSGLLVGLEVDGISYILPTAGTAVSVPAGQKFKFIMSNGAGEPPQTQTWLVYAQTFSNSKIKFNMHFTLTPDDAMTNIILISEAPYQGFLRTAAIQTSTPLAAQNRIAQRTTHNWQLATQMQSIPATPLSMFMLWPYNWTKTVGAQLVYNQYNNIYTSACTTNSLLIPLLARSDLATATCWYDQLIDKQTRGLNVFDIGTNSFVTLVNMLIAYYYDSDINSYQSSLARGVSTPAQSIPSDATQLEQMFDTYRSSIALNAELEFNLNGNYSFLLTSLDVFSTLPAGSAQSPLQAFPGFKTLADGFALQPYVNEEPIKGDVAYVAPSIADIPGDFIVTFKTEAIPSWAKNFLPNDFWQRIQGSDQTNVLLQLQNQIGKALPGLSSDTYEQGKLLFQAAMTAKYMTYVLLAEQGALPPYPTDFLVPSAVKSAVQPFITYIENILDAWLATHEYLGTVLTNYLTADDDAKGIVAIKGATSPTGGLLDSGNAVYTGHNRQYGYFLISAAIAIELDQLFGNTPWIASDLTSTATAYIGPTKQFVDMLWRDYANPAIDDLESMPFNRYGNPWEGLSCEKGVPPVGAFPARYNTSISEDFNGYYGVWLYARAIEDAPTAAYPAGIPLPDKQGFATLERYAKTNLDMIMRAARGLFYNSSVWVYENSPFNFNQTTGVEWDNEVNAAPIGVQLQTPACGLTKEGCIYSEYKFDLFGKDLVDFFNKDCNCTTSGCNCN